MFCSGNQRVVLSRASLSSAILTSAILRQRTWRNHLHSGKALRDLAGTVGRAVIDYYDLEADAGLRGQRFETRGEVGLFVAGRNDDRDLGYRRTPERGSTGQGGQWRGWM